MLLLLSQANTAVNSVNLDLQKQALGILPGADKTPEVGFGNFISGLLTGVFALAALLVFMYLIWGAISWITAGGDKGKVEQARNRMTQSIVGMIVLASAVALFIVLQQFLNIEIINFVGGKSGTTIQSTPGTGTIPSTLLGPGGGRTGKTP